MMFLYLVKQSSESLAPRLHSSWFDSTTSQKDHTPQNAGPLRAKTSRSTNDDQIARLDLMMRMLPSTKIVRFVLAPVLSLWIAGAGCMMGCEGMVAAAATAPSSISEKHSGHHSGRNATRVASGQGCSSGGSHSCCAKNPGETKPAAERTNKSDTALIMASGSSSGMMKDCPLAVGRAPIPAKIRINEVAAAPVLANSALPAENSLEQSAPLSTPLRLHNRGHTYLRCCVFLI